MLFRPYDFPDLSNLRNLCLIPLAGTGDSLCFLCGGEAFATTQKLLPQVLEILEKRN